jgi:hypothetical protein
VRSFAIITTEPNELCAELHNRMPVVLAPEAWPQWLGEEPAGLSHLKALLSPHTSDDMICWPVSTRIGKRQEQRSQFDRSGCCGVISHFRPAEIVNLDDHRSMVFDLRDDRVPPSLIVPAENPGVPPPGFSIVRTHRASESRP